MNTLLPLNQRLPFSLVGGVATGVAVCVEGMRAGVLYSGVAGRILSTPPPRYS